MGNESRPIHEVFISYSSKDKKWADAACGVLEKHKIRCWIAPRDITPGTEWGAAIISGMDGSKIMVLIFSTHANQSAQVRREVERAIGKGLAVLPFRIEDVSPEGAMEYALSNTHWLDGFTPPIERQFDLLARSVNALLGRHVGPVAAPAPSKPAAAARIKSPEGSRVTLGQRAKSELRLDNQLMDYREEATVEPLAQEKLSPNLPRVPRPRMRPERLPALLFLGALAVLGLGAAGYMLIIGNSPKPMVNQVPTASGPAIGVAPPRPNANQVPTASGRMIGRAPRRPEAKQGQTASTPTIEGTEKENNQVWEGNLRILTGSQIRLVLHLAKTDAGAFVATLDSPDQSAYGIKVDSVTLDDETLMFEIKKLVLRFSGKIEPGGTVAIGEAEQGPYGKFPLTLRKRARRQNLR
jgi:TIR domain